MSELGELVVRWQRGWGVSRGVPASKDVGGAVRAHCRQNGREVEYFAYDDTDLARLAQLVRGEEAVTWLTVPSAEPDRAAADLEAAGLVLLKRSEQLMTIDLGEHPPATPAEPYRIRTRVDGGAITVEVLDASGAEGAHGWAGLSGGDAVADRILTAPEHRRRGLGRAVMSALATTAREHGAGTGLLVASDEGQRLYQALGWRPVAEVLIASTPGVEFPA
ncbi:GNAT family N-acetyltransferase [Actinoplanes sp. NPDC026619]|uniref:GNAT family N-acetyltransferase n=1 Tax=Actinoplanes sp. NPDC026619 TaxID=3155798 RepID=UPI00340BCCD0